MTEKEEKLKEPTWRELKNIFLAKKQGEALERASTPRTQAESISLGNFGHQAVYALAVIQAHEEFIFSLTGYEGNILSNFVENIGKGSGSIGAKRMTETLQTVGQLGQYKPMEGFSGDMHDESDEES